jgi:membrane protein
MLKQAVVAWMDDYAPSMGAALAYYTMFSLAPLLLLAIAVAGLVFGQEAARGQIVSQLGSLVGKEGAEAIQGLLKSAGNTGTNIIATSISVITLLIGATTIFGELQTDLDRIWRAPAAPGPAGLWGLIRTRLLSLGMVASIGFLLVVSLVVSAMLSALGQWWGWWFGGWAIVLQIVNQVTSFGIITVLFALMYRILPRVKVEWRDVWIGSAATALLFTLGKYAVGVYIGRAAVASGFGAAGSIVVLLVWFYYSSQLFLLGAEFTWVYAQSHGSHAAEASSSKTVASSRNPQEQRTQKNVDPGVDDAANIAPAATTSVAQTAPAGWQFLYAGMVSVAFGLVHWFLRTHPSPATTATGHITRRSAAGVAVPSTAARSDNPM